MGGASALCASRGESRKHVGALRLLGQVLGRMSVVLVRTCLPCLTWFLHVSNRRISVEAVWAPPLPPVWSPGNCHHQVAGGLPLPLPRCWAAPWAGCAAGCCCAA